MEIDDVRRLKTVAQLLPFYLEACEERNLRRTTMVNKHVWAKWLITHWGDRQVRRVSDGQIVRLAQVKSLSFAQSTQAFFRWLMRVKVVRVTFDVGKLPQAVMSDERHIKYLSPDDVVKFLAAVKPAYKAAFIVAIYAGLRPYEVCRLEWRAINLQERRIRVEGKVSKIRRVRMIEGIPAIIWQLLRPYVQAEGYLVPGPDEERRVFRMLYERDRAGRAAGVSLSHDVFRHTFATFYSAWTGHSAMCARILGHYKLSTLAAHYDGVATRAEAKRFFSGK